MTGARLHVHRHAAVMAVTLAGALIVGGCATVPNEPTDVLRVGSTVIVGNGGEAGGWRAWAYRTQRGDLCVEVDGTAGGGHICGTDDSMETPGIVVTEKARFVVGVTSAADAASARLDDADGSSITANLVDVTPMAPGLRVYVMPTRPSSSPTSVVILDATGSVLGSFPVDG